jgi:ribonucleoside-diphosphate reductase alpha chain
VFDPRGGHWVAGRYVPSLLAAIGDVIELHLINIGFIPDPAEEREESLRQAVNDTIDRGHARFRVCPRCGQPTLIRQEGCDTCTSCVYSKCG